MSGQKICLKARWALPIASEPVHDAVVVIDGEKIEAVLPRQEFNARYRSSDISESREYRDAIIMPGLINIHSHLDYSAARAFETEPVFFGWIKRLIETVRDWDDERWLQSALLGARLSALSGTTTVVDSTKTGCAARALASVGLKGVVGLELFGVFDQDTEGRWAEWLGFHSRLTNLEEPAFQAALRHGKIKLTVSPHAPYTVCPTLWLKAMNWADREGLPVLAHVAESSEECLWLAEGSEIVDRFMQFAMASNGKTDRAVLPKWQGRGLTPVRHLKSYGLLNDNLIAAHAIFVDDNDIGLLAESGVKIAHCPRSNARLRNGAAPIDRFMAFAIPFAIGTDSLASSDDLSPLSEAQFAFNMHRSRFPDIGLTAKDMIESVTLKAAQLLKMDDLIGSLKPGMKADLAVFALPPSPLKNEEKAALDPYNLLLCGGARLRDLIVDGDFVVSGGKLKKGPN